MSMNQIVDNVTRHTNAALAEVSALSQADFVARLGDIFEHSPWIAQRSWVHRPFVSVDALHSAMLGALYAASADEQLGLMCAHPELAGREADAGTLTVASTQEQRGAGLDQCSKEEWQRLRDLNAAYRQRFGFPFVIAVKGLTRYQVIAAIVARLNNERSVEFDIGLREIAKIARFRLDAMFA